MKTISMKSKIGALVVTTSLLMAFQNCNKSKDDNPSDGAPAAPTNNGNNNGGNQPTGGTTGTNPTGGGTDSFQLGRGDSIYYLSGNLQIPQFKSVKISAKFGSAFQTVETTLPSGQSFDVDLKKTYCDGSALPHCRRINSVGCVGESCPPIDLPLVCHQEILMSQTQLNQYFSALNSVTATLTIKTLDLTNPQVSDCDDPYLSLNSNVNRDIKISLAPKACIPTGTFYPTGDSSPFKSAMANSISTAEAGGEYCSSYSRLWHTTSFKYASVSGYGLAENRYFYGVEYLGNQTANLRWLDPGAAHEMCAKAVLVDPNELSAFFPDAGLGYKVLRTSAQLADAATKEIEFSDAEDNNLKWRFFLTEATALTHGGGALVQSAQSNAISAAATSLINRAKTLSLGSKCQ